MTWLTVSAVMWCLSNYPDICVHQTDHDNTPYQVTFGTGQEGFAFPTLQEAEMDGERIAQKRDRSQRLQETR